MTRKIPFANSEYYHVYNRGVEKRKIFLDEEDYNRFIYILNAFNKQTSIYNISRDAKVDLGENYYSVRGQTPDRLVEIENWCLMPNHYHLCLYQLADRGISRFLQKVMTGYTMYFNKKYDRSGVLFQGKAKSKWIDSDKHLMVLNNYIDLNPLDLFENYWKDKGFKNTNNSIIKKLENYKWNKQENYSDLKEMLGVDSQNRMDNFLMG